MPHPDQKYVDALLTNDALLLTELYQKYSGAIKRMVLYNSGTEADARDVFQEALLAIYKKAKTGAFVLICPLEAFLYLVCKNKWISELHKRNRRGVTFRDTEGYTIEEDSLRLAEECSLQQKRMALLYEKVAQLGESCRQLLLLSWRKRPMEEIASALNITYGYARKKKSECMARLMLLIKADPEFENLKW